METFKLQGPLDAHQVFGDPKAFLEPKLILNLNLFIKKSLRTKCSAFKQNEFSIFRTQNLLEPVFILHLELLD